MLLQLLVKKIKTKNLIGSTNKIVNNITHDSRKATKASVFCAIRGFQVDGHSYIESAISKGAIAILCENLPKQLYDEITYIQVEDVKNTMALFSDEIYGQPSKKLHITGITGTNGKTSITQLLKTIYEHLDKKTGTIGTLGITVGSKKIPSSHTTPESTEIHDVMAQMVGEGIENCMMEVSSHALELQRVSHIDFNTGIFTNLTPDHLCFHGSMEDYFQAKKKLFYLTQNINIINIDDPYGQRLYDELKDAGRPVTSYAINKDADYVGTIISTKADGTTFTLKTGDEERIITSNTPGCFSVYNHLASIAAAHLDNHSVDNILDHILESITSYPGTDGRFEFLTKKEDFHVVLDFAHTPDGLRNVLKTLSEFTTGRRIVVFGAGGSRDDSRRYPMGKVAGEHADYCILTTDNPCNENPMDICHEIAKGIEENHHNYRIILDRKEAVSYAMEIVKKGDAVLLAGKAYEHYQVIGNKKIYYNEKEIALGILYQT